MESRNQPTLWQALKNLIILFNTRTDPLDEEERQATGVLEAGGGGAVRRGGVWVEGGKEGEGGGQGDVAMENK